MQDVVLAALLVVDDELQRDPRAARPIGERRRAAVADHVARIGFSHKLAHMCSSVLLEQISASSSEGLDPPTLAMTSASLPSEPADSR